MFIQHVHRTNDVTSTLTITVNKYKQSCHDQFMWQKWVHVTALILTCHVVYILRHSRTERNQHSNTNTWS